MPINQLSVFLENKSGRLAEIAALIAANGIDVRALALADTSDFGVLRLIVDQPAPAAALLKAAGLAVTLTPVTAVTVPDRPGSFAHITAALAGAGVAVEYMYAFAGQTEGAATVILRLSDGDKGAAALVAAGVTVLS